MPKLEQSRLPISVDSINAGLNRVELIQDGDTYYLRLSDRPGHKGVIIIPPEVTDHTDVFKFAYQIAATNTLETTIFRIESHLAGLVAREKLRHLEGSVEPREDIKVGGTD